MTLWRKNNISYYTFDALDDLGVKHGIFMRHGGCSDHPWSSLNLATSVGDSREHVIENRKRITDILGRDPGSIFDVWQVHSNTVLFSDSPRKLSEVHKKADAIVTDNNKITLLMLFADCVPILLYDRKENVSAIAHAGWRGTVNKVVGETIRKMIQDKGCKPQNIIACIGPSICADHYTIGEEVAAEIKGSFSHTNRFLFTKNDQFHLNLQTANQHILHGLGVENILISGICTAGNTIDWYSHRAENGRTGRFGAVMTCR